MTIADINNKHSILGVIPWQFQHGTHIVQWVSNLSEFGYKSCGKVFDDICDGIIHLHDELVTPIAQYTVQALAGAFGFDWGTATNIPDTLFTIFSTKFFGFGSLAEFDRTMTNFGITYNAWQLSHGGLVRIKMDGDNSIDSLNSQGIRVPMSVNEKYLINYSPSTAMTFSNDTWYDPNTSPRLCSEDEETFPDKGKEEGWDLHDVFDGTIWVDING